MREVQKMREVQRIRNCFFVFNLCLFLASCQNAPTKMYQQVPTASKEASRALAITDRSVIVDARPAFEYSVSHLNGSINLRPEDFTQREAPFRGLLELDLFQLTRYLGRLGIGPDTPVVVVGRGTQGSGEEGRVAWTLRYLGVKQVEFAAMDHFSLPLTSAEAPPKTPVTIWKPEEDESLQISKEDFLALLQAPRTSADAPVVIDVRSGAEYLNKANSGSVPKKSPDLGAINIPWTEFLNQAGRPQEAVKSRLEAVGITSERPVILISNKGVRSAAVTMVLRELGYSKATNFSGGYQQLLSKR